MIDEILTPTKLGNRELLVKSNRSWVQRTFSKLHKDSLRASIFIMLLTAFGTGIFSIHHVFNRIGILLAYATIIAFGFFYVLSSDILIFCFKTFPYSKSINQLMKNVLGPRWGLVYDLLFFVFIFLSLITQLLSMSGAFYNNFEKLIWSIFQVDKHSQTFEYFNYYFCLALGCILTVISAKRFIHQYRYLSLIAFAIFLYILIIALLQVIPYYFYRRQNHEDDYVWLKADAVGFLSFYGIVVYSYNCIINFFSVSATVGYPKIRRLRKIFRRTFFLIALILIVFGTVSYISLGSKEANEVELFIFRAPNSDSDVLMFVGRTILIVGLCVVFGLTLFPLKEMIFSLLNLQRSSFNNYALTIGLTMASAITSACFPTLSTKISACGALPVTLIVFTFPGLCALKIEYTEKYWGRLLLTAWIVVLSVMGLIGSYLTFFHQR